MDPELEAWIEEQSLRAPIIPKETLEELADSLGILLDH